MIDEVCRLLRHAAAATTRTEAAWFAREGHEALVGAVVAPHAREAPREHTARQELPELALDEAGEAATLAAVADLAQEGFQVLADDAMENSALRGPGLIGDDPHGRRASEARAAPGSVPKAALPPSTTRRCATGRRNTALRAESDCRRHGRRKRRTRPRATIHRWTEAGGPGASSGTVSVRPTTRSWPGPSPTGWQ